MRTDERKEAEIAELVALYRQMNRDEQRRITNAIIICLRDNVPMQTAIGRAGLVH